LSYERTAGVGSADQDRIAGGRRVRERVGGGCGGVPRMLSSTYVEFRAGRGRRGWTCRQG